MIICKNCGSEVQGQYCSHCGQRASHERINFQHVLHQIFHYFTHIEKGFLFTSLQMLKKPGQTCLGFIEGKRKNYQPPLSYFLIWNAVYLLVIYLTSTLFGENKAINAAGYFGEQTKFALANLNIILIFLLPIQALYIYLFLMLKKHNYFESFTVALFFAGTIMLLQILFFIAAIIIYLITGFSTVLELSDILKFVYTVWMIANLVKFLPIKQKLLRSACVIIFAGLTFFAWRVFVFPHVAELFF